MPRKAVGKQPPQEGPIWEAFVRYWRHAIDDSGRRATAWRAFHAGHCAAHDDVVEPPPSVGTGAKAARPVPAEAVRTSGPSSPA
ncbi:MAG: hypothetical protein ACOY4R_11195 [Pseudomonadota bacterium]